MLAKLGRYLIESEIGRGGMGVVYRGRDEKLGKLVAVKMLSEPGSWPGESRARLRQEARSAAILNHPSIVAVYDYDEEEGSPFIVYEYIDGETLDKRIAGGPLPEDKIVEIGSQIASGLAYAHERGILHRDIKPQNIIVGTDGRAKILDFGIAKKMRLNLVAPDGSPIEDDSAVTLAGTILGTVQYMSPEQVAGETLDGRADVFSLGTVLWEMATGTNPFLGKSVTSTVGRIMSSETPRFETDTGRISDELQAIILRALQKRREDRYQSALLLYEDLERTRGLYQRDKLSSSRFRPGAGLEPRGSTVAGAVSVIPRKLARISLILLQILYLVVYGIALVKHIEVIVRMARLSGDFIGNLEAARWLTTGLLITGCCGIPVRLFLMASVAFDDPDTGRQFRRLFPFLFVLDELWALTPLLLVGKWPAGLAVIGVVLLAYLPISQRILVRSAYP